MFMKGCFEVTCLTASIRFYTVSLHMHSQSQIDCARLFPSLDFGAELGGQSNFKITA